MLKQANCMKRITAIADVKLEANAGESFLIRGIYVAPDTDNDYLVLKVDRKTVGAYRIQGRSGNHLDVMRTGYLHKNLMEFLTSKGINCTIPVAEGQSFSVQTPGTSPVVVIVYDIYDAGDIRADMMNGTDSKEYLFIQYMDTSDSVTEAQTSVLDTSLSPSEFPDFPCGKSVPANTEIEILGLVGTPCGEGFSDSAYIGSTFVKLVKDRETLFDEDRNGIPFFFQAGNVTPDYFSKFSLIGGCTSMVTADDGMGVSYNTTLGNPLMFDPVLKFDAGEELIISMSFVEGGDRTLPANSIDFGAIMKVNAA